MPVASYAGTDCRSTGGRDTGGGCGVAGRSGGNMKYKILWTKDLLWVEI